MHRDELRAFRGSVERHLEYLVRLNGHRVLTSLDAPAERVPIAARQICDYQSFPDPRFRRAIRRLESLLGRTWDVFWIVLPAFLMWLILMPSAVYSRALALAAGIVCVIVGGCIAARSGRGEAT